MNQIVKDKMQREVMAVKNDFLFENIERKTKVYTNEEVNFEQIILDNFEFKVRGPVETNFDYKQPITYAIVMNEKNEIFVYIR